MAITIDIGDPNNVHPADKIDVGQRLALLAKKMVYGENVVASGPLFKKMEIDGGKVRVQFTETGSGLTIGQQPWCAKGVAPFPKDKLIGFFLAGDDKKWIEAEASIDGDNVSVVQPASAESGGGALRLGQFAALQSLQPGRPARLAIPHG